MDSLRDSDSSRSNSDDDQNQNGQGQDEEPEEQEEQEHQQNNNQENEQNNNQEASLTQQNGPFQPTPRKHSPEVVDFTLTQNLSQSSSTLTRTNSNSSESSSALTSLFSSVSQVSEDIPIHSNAKGGSGNTHQEIGPETPKEQEKKQVVVKEEIKLEVVKDEPLNGNEETSFVNDGIKYETTQETEPFPSVVEKDTPPPPPSPPLLPHPQKKERGHKSTSKNKRDTPPLSPKTKKKERPKTTTHRNKFRHR